MPTSFLTFNANPLTMFIGGVGTSFIFKNLTELVKAPKDRKPHSEILSSTIKTGLVMTLISPFIEACASFNGIVLEKAVEQLGAQSGYAYYPLASVVYTSLVALEFFATVAPAKKLDEATSIISTTASTISKYVDRLTGHATAIKTKVVE